RGALVPGRVGDADAELVGAVGDLRRVDVQQAAVRARARLEVDVRAVAGLRGDGLRQVAGEAVGRHDRAVEQHLDALDARLVVAGRVGDAVRPAHRAGADQGATVDADRRLDHP